MLADLEETKRINILKDSKEAVVLNKPKPSGFKRGGELRFGMECFLDAVDFIAPGFCRDEKLSTTHIQSMLGACENVRFYATLGYSPDFLPAIREHVLAYLKGLGYSEEAIVSRYRIEGVTFDAVSNFFIIFNFLLQKISDNYGFESYSDWNPRLPIDSLMVAL